MKTYRNLYPQICDFENIYAAYRRARRGKRGKAPVADFMRNQEDELLALQDELQTKTYAPGPYHSFYIHDPKRRLKLAVSFQVSAVRQSASQLSAIRLSRQLAAGHLVAAFNNRRSFY